MGAGADELLDAVELGLGQVGGKPGLKGIPHDLQGGVVENPRALGHGQVVVEEEVAQVVFQILREGLPLLDQHVDVFHPVLVEPLAVFFRRSPPVGVEDVVSAQLQIDSELALGPGKHEKGG